jgi:hypothetical protein
MESLNILQVQPTGWGEVLVLGAGATYATLGSLGSLGSEKTEKILKIRDFLGSEWFFGGHVVEPRREGYGEKWVADGRREDRLLRIVLTLVI